MATILLGSIKANAFWHGVLLGIGSIIDQRIFSKTSTTTLEGQRMSDLSLQSSAYGVAIPKVYGTMRVSGNVIWGTNYVEHRKEETSGGGGGKGGGGGGSKVTTVTYTYSVSCAVALHDGAIAGVRRVWADGKEVTDAFFGTSPTINHTLYYGTQTQEADPFIQAIESDKYTPAYRGLAYIVLKDFDVTDFGNRIPNFTFEIVREVHDLEGIIQEASADAGLQVGDDIDLASKDFFFDSINGMQITADDTYRERLEQLMSVHDFFAVETNGRVFFQYRKDCEQYPVSLTHFGAKEGERSENKMYNVTRLHDLELPRSVSVSYISLDKDYESGSMDAVRPTSKSRQTTSIQLKELVLTDARAKQLAEIKLYEAYVRRSVISLSLPMWWAFLAPGDILLCELADRRRTVQITKTTFSPPGVLSVEATDIGGNTYSRIERNADAEVLPSLPVSPSPVTLYLLDIPRLPVDTTTSLRLYAAAAGKPFYGAALYETRDNGASWQLKGAIDNCATAGFTTSLLPAGAVDCWDWANKVTVTLVNGTLESRPEIDVLNGFNTAVIGNEIVQFQNARLLSAHTYELSGLLRGRLGTEDQIGLHALEERFVLLESATLTTIPSPLNEWYSVRRYEIGPATLPVTDALYEPVEFCNLARAYQPWSVCNVVGVRESNGTLKLTWNRRDRSGGEWLDGSDIAMSEQSEKYEIDIVSGAVIKRTLVDYTPSVVYTAAMQLEDFDALQPSVTVRIYQISALRGRGVVKEVSV